MRLSCDSLDIVGQAVSGYTGQRMINLPGKRISERQHKRCMDVVKEDMESVGVKEEDARDRVRWR